MNKSDEFFTKTDAIKKFHSQLKAEFNKRSVLTAKNESTALLDAGIRGKFDEYEKTLRETKSIIEGYRSKPDFSQNEINRRIQLYQDMHQQFNALKSQYNTSLVKKSNFDVNDAEITIDPSKDLQVQLKKDMEEQEELVDNFGVVLKRLKKKNREIGNELENQDPMIKKLGDKMGRVEVRLKNTDSKMDNYLEQSSNSCLHMTICIELAVMLLLLLW